MKNTTLVNQNEIRREVKKAQKKAAQKRSKKNSFKKVETVKRIWNEIPNDVIDIYTFGYMSDSESIWNEYNNIGFGGKLILKAEDNVEYVITKHCSGFSCIEILIFDLIEDVPVAWKDKWFELSEEDKEKYRAKYKSGNYIKGRRAGLEINENFWYLQKEGLEEYFNPNELEENIEFIMYHYEIYVRNNNMDYQYIERWWFDLQDWTHFTDRCKVDPRELGKLLILCSKISIDECLSYFERLFSDEINNIIKMLKFIRDDEINIFIWSIINDQINMFDISIAIDVFENNWKGESDPVSLKGLLSIIKQAKWAHHINNESIIENKVWYSKECHIKKKMEELFLDKFGRCPKIIDYIYCFSIVNNINYKEIIDRFNVKSMKKMIDQYGVHTSLYINYIHPELNGMDKEIVDLIKKTKKISCDLIQWISNHKKTDNYLLSEIIHNEKLLSKVVDIKSATLNEIKKILIEKESLKEFEKAQKKYNFSELKCSIENTEVQNGDQLAFILDANSARQATIGYDTNCCQHLGSIGESAMMYGMLAENAGFWAIEQKYKIVAQAEIWLGLLDNKEVLVFDNIELANDRDFNLIRGTLEKWLEASPYENIIMGTGHNVLSHGYNFAKGDLVQPKCELVPNPYTDAKECVWLKKEGEVQYIKENKKDE